MAKDKKEKKAKESEEAEEVETAEVDETIEEPETASEEPETASEENEFSEIDKIKNECKDVNEKFIRLQAEFQNFKKRTEKEKGNLYKYANEKLFVDLLPLMDNMERALDSTELGSDGIVAGLKMIKKSFDDLFEKNGVKAIESVGGAFNPELHHAVMSDDSDDHDSEQVIEEFQKGYTLNEKVIRHSMVKVSK